MRITRLPPHLEEQVPSERANPQSLGFVVAAVLQRRARPRRVYHLTDDGIELYNGALGSGLDLEVEYAAPGTICVPANGIA